MLPFPLEKTTVAGVPAAVRIGLRTQCHRAIFRPARGAGACLATGADARSGPDRHTGVYRRRAARKSSRSGHAHTVSPLRYCAVLYRRAGQHHLPGPRAVSLAVRGREQPAAARRVQDLAGGHALYRASSCCATRRTIWTRSTTRSPPAAAASARRLAWPASPISMSSATRPSAPCRTWRACSCTRPSASPASWSRRTAARSRSPPRHPNAALSCAWARWACPTSST